MVGKNNQLSISMDGDKEHTTDFGHVSYRIPLVKQDDTTQGKIIIDKDIKNMPVRNINELIIGF